MTKNGLGGGDVLDTGKGLVFSGQLGSACKHGKRLGVRALSEGGEQGGRLNLGEIGGKGGAAEHGDHTEGEEGGTEKVTHVYLLAVFREEGMLRAPSQEGAVGDQ